MNDNNERRAKRRRMIACSSNDTRSYSKEDDMDEEPNDKEEAEMVTEENGDELFVSNTDYKTNSSNKSICSEWVPYIAETLKSTRLSTLIQTCYDLEVIKPLKVLAYDIVIRFDWNSIDKHMHLVDRWHYAYQRLLALMKLFNSEGNGTMFCVASLEVQDGKRNHHSKKEMANRSKSRKRNRSKEQSVASIENIEEEIEESIANESNTGDEDDNDKLAKRDELIDKYRKDVQYGMPKIVFIAYMKSLNGKERSWKEFAKLITDSTYFTHISVENIQVRTKSNEILLMKAIKNHSHGWSLNQMKNAMQLDDNYNVNVKKYSLLYWWSYNEDAFNVINPFVTKMITSNLKIESWNHLTLKRMNSNDGQVKVDSSPPYTKNKFELFMIKIKEAIIKEGLLYKNKHLYKKTDNAKFSYNVYKSLEDYISDLTSVYETAFEVAKYGDKFIQFVQGIGCKFLPVFNPNYSYVEYNDWVYNLDNGEFISKSSLAQDTICFVYFDIDAQTICDVEPTNWLSILKNSFSEEKIYKFCYNYAKLFRKKKPRDECLALIGPTKCGKTTLLDPLYKIYGNHMIALVGKKSNFPLEDIPGTLLVIMDEFSEKDMTRGQLLELLEGKPMKLDKKWDNNIKAIITQPCVIVTNEDFYADDESGAVDGRLNKFYFKTIPKANINMKQRIIDETALILYYCNEIYLNYDKLNK